MSDPPPPPPKKKKKMGERKREDNYLAWGHAVVIFAYLVLSYDSHADSFLFHFHPKGGVGRLDYSADGYMQLRYSERIV